MTKFINLVAMNTMNTAANLKKRITNLLSNNRGEGFVDTALKILISVVVGGLLLAGLYMLFKDTVLPTLTQKISDMFNFQG